MENILRSGIRNGLLQYYRNGRWGTCGDCPRDSDGRVYPEFCLNTKRYDHWLTIEDLSEQIQIDIREDKKVLDDLQKKEEVCST